MRNKRKKAATATRINPADSPLGIRMVLSVPTYGARYSVCRRTVWRWVSQGMPFLKLGTRSVRIPVAEADRWINENFRRYR